MPTQTFSGNGMYTLDVSNAAWVDFDIIGAHGSNRGTSGGTVYGGACSTGNYTIDCSDFEEIYVYVAAPGSGSSGGDGYTNGQDGQTSNGRQGGGGGGETLVLSNDDPANRTPLCGVGGGGGAGNEFGVDSGDNPAGGDGASTGAGFAPGGSGGRGGYSTEFFTRQPQDGSPGGSYANSSYEVLTSFSSGNAGRQTAKVTVSFSPPPSPVTNTTATAVSSDAIDVSWSDPNNTDTDVDEYRVYRSTSPGVTTDDTLVGTVQSGTTSFTDSGLQESTQYHYMVTAFNPGGPSPASPETTATTLLPAPTNVSVSAGSRQATVVWTDITTSGESYEIHRSQSSGVDTTGEPVSTVAAGVESYTGTGLNDGTQYHYRVVAVVDGQAGSDSAEVVATTDLPAPTDLTHPSASDESAEYAWTTNHDNGETRVEYREDSASTWQTYSTVAFDVESETVDGLLNGQLYESRVVAQTPDAETEDQ